MTPIRPALLFTTLSSYSPFNSIFFQFTKSLSCDERRCKHSARPSLAFDGVPPPPAPKSLAKNDGSSWYARWWANDDATNPLAPKSLAYLERSTPENPKTRANDAAQTPDVKTLAANEDSNWYAPKSLACDELQTSNAQALALDDVLIPHGSKSWAWDNAFDPPQIQPKETEPDNRYSETYLFNGIAVQQP